MALYSAHGASYPKLKDPTPKLCNGAAFLWFGLKTTLVITTITF
jgi:hypothetical protein